MKNKSFILWCSVIWKWWYFWIFGSVVGFILIFWYIVKEKIFFLFVWLYRFVIFSFEGEVYLVIVMFWSVVGGIWFDCDVRGVGIWFFWDWIMILESLMLRLCNWFWMIGVGFILFSEWEFLLSYRLVWSLSRVILVVENCLVIVWIFMNYLEMDVVYI